jgi:hypothetical protein
MAITAMELNFDAFKSEDLHEKHGSSAIWKSGIISAFA